jgi:antitoxin MazE
MQVSKWGNSLAVRLPAALVKTLEIKPGDEIEISVKGDRQFEVERDPRRLEALEAICRLAKPLPPGYKFNRDEIYDRNERSLMGRQESNLESSQELEAQ